MRITYPSLLVLTLTLAACGGGSGGGSGNPPASNQATPPGTTQPPAVAPSSQVIEYYGDSTVWGYPTGSDGGQQVETTAPEAFAAALPSSPTRYAVINEGVSGSNACSLLNGTDGTHPDWNTQMAASRADVVIVNHAINQPAGGDMETYKSCLRGLAQGASARGKKLVFETPNPITRGSVADYAQAMKDVASEQRVPVIDQYAYLMRQFDNDASRVAPDGLHPSDEVYIMKGRYAAGVFVTLLPL